MAAPPDLRRAREAALAACSPGVGDGKRHASLTSRPFRRGVLIMRTATADTGARCRAAQDPHLGPRRRQRHPGMEARARRLRADLAPDPRLRGARSRRAGRQSDARARRSRTTRRQSSATRTTGSRTRPSWNCGGRPNRCSRTRTWQSTSAPRCSSCPWRWGSSAHCARLAQQGSCTATSREPTRSSTGPTSSRSSRTTPPGSACATAISRGSATTATTANTPRAC